MTIRRKLGFSFGAILALFGLTLVIYFWSATERSRTVDTLRLAISRQSLLATVSQDLHNVHQQITLLSGVTGEAGEVCPSPDEQKAFAAQLDGISKKLGQLESQTEPADRAEIQELRSTFELLARSWKVYYQNFGVNQNAAVMELALRADPLSEKVLKLLVPHLQEAEERRVDRAKAESAKVSRIVDRITVIIFFVSLLMALIIAVRVSRHLTRAISELILGTSVLSVGQLDHRIVVRSDDELGQLGSSFNEMASSLAAAQERVQQRTQEIEREKRISEKLLLNILPAAVAEELQAKGSVSPKYFEDVTMMFTDFVGFTKASEKLAVEDLVHLLHDFFTNFDQVIKKYGLEKLKTIGDSYMCAGGIPTKHSSHPVDTVLAAFEILEVIARSNEQTRSPWGIRIGIHTGPVAAGVVGIDKFAFDVWGDTVNFAARLQAAGQPNRINISENTYRRVKDFFECEYRGKIETKEKKEFEMYFVNGIHPNLLNGLTSSGVPEPFLKRYQIYFSKEPPGFPTSLLTRAASIPR